MKPEDHAPKPSEPDVLEQIEPRLSRLRSIGLPMALVVSIGVALILTAISIGLYYSSNLSRIDLSKPKYADIREDVLNGGDEQQDDTLDRDSPITNESVKKAIQEMKSRRDDLRQLGGFNSSIMNDSQLGIDAKTPAVQ